MPYVIDNKTLTKHYNKEGKPEYKVDIKLHYEDVHISEKEIDNMINKLYSNTLYIKDKKKLMTHLNFLLDEYDFEIMINFKIICEVINKRKDL